MEAQLACARCGAFVAPEAAVNIDGALYCPVCAARPDVDYVEAFRLKHWGKRDALAWTMLGGALLAAAGLVLALTNRRWSLAAALAAHAIVLGAFFFGARWARLGLVLLTAASMGLAYASGAADDAPALLLLPVSFAAGVYFNVRNRLFFEIEVPRRALWRAWNRHANNLIAQNGMALGAFSVLFPPFAPFALVCSIVGLLRVDPDARPPVGKRAQAIAGIAFSLLGFAAAAFYAFAVW